MSNLDLSDQFLTTSISSKIHPYLYGCIFNKEDGTIEFLNNNKAYSGNKRDSYNVYDENDETNNENKIKYNKIKNKIEKRLELIYNKKTIDYNNIFSRKKKEVINYHLIYQIMIIIHFMKILIVIKIEIILHLLEILVM